jgi:23S rRNA (cytidine1920-2'-O)/16S rRNA (cytidine1409-2'-O)-methyltransferase
VAKSRRARFVALTDLLARHRPDADPSVIAGGRVLIDGRVITNPAARVRADSALRVLSERRLRGDLKLSAALDQLAVPVAGRIALDLGASAGGFTTALLARGARRVYAVDAGVGQLLGRLRIDPRVVNLEGHNLGLLDTKIVPEVVELVTIDLSYLALAEAFPELERIRLHQAAHVIALVKPTFELGRACLASAEDDMLEALDLASRAAEAAGWTVVAHCTALATGRRGAREIFFHARRRKGEEMQPAFEAAPSS